MIVLTALTALVTVGGVSLIAIAMKSSWPSEKALREHFKQLEAKTEILVTDFLPLDTESLELFSFQQINHTRKKGLTPTVSGVFTTIFEEPVLAYAYKKFMGGGVTENALIVARSANHVFSYTLRKKIIQLNINSQDVGYIKNDVLYGKKSKNPIAEIKAADNTGTRSIVIDNIEMGLLLPNNMASKKISGRAFQFVKDEMSKRQLLLFIALTGIHLILQEME